MKKIETPRKLALISKNLKTILNQQGLSKKDLSDKAGIPMTTLGPILKGERDFRLSSLLALSTALDVTTDELLKGVSTNKNKMAPSSSKPEYLILFLNNYSFSYVQIYNQTDATTTSIMLPYTIFCIENPDKILQYILTEIELVIGNVAPKKIAFYSSVLCYEYVPGRTKLISAGAKLFNKFILEPDWYNTHKSILPNISAILITITNGFVLSYSLDKGKTILKHQGYGFPLSDDAGNIWIGCQALRHTINVQEGVDKRTLLSDKLLAHYKSDLNLITTHVYDDYINAYSQAAVIVKELATKAGKSSEIIAQSFKNIYKHVKKIDELSKLELPIYLSGDLAYLYEQYIPEGRFKKMDHDEMLKKQFSYASSTLR
jgi:transcriptional regulator with XRE-family HTH domain